MDYDRDMERPQGGVRDFDTVPKVFVGGLHYNTRAKALGQHFARCGEIVAVDVINDPVTGRSRGYGFIEFADFSSMQRALDEMNNTILDGNTLKVDRATKPRDYAGPPRGDYAGREGPSGGSKDGGYGPGYGDRGTGGSYGPERRQGVRKHEGFRITITNLPPGTGWADLKDLLRQSGDCTYTNVYPDGSGVGEYGTIAECMTAIRTLGGTTLNGSRIRLEPLNFDPHERPAGRGGREPYRTGGGSSYGPRGYPGGNGEERGYQKEGAAMGPAGATCRLGAPGMGSPVIGTMAGVPARGVMKAEARGMRGLATLAVVAMAAGKGARGMTGGSMETPPTRNHQLVAAAAATPLAEVGRDQEARDCRPTAVPADMVVAWLLMVAMDLLPMALGVGHAGVAMATELGRASMVELAMVQRGLMRVGVVDPGAPAGARRLRAGMGT